MHFGRPEMCLGIWDPEMRFNDEMHAKHSAPISNDDKFSYFMVDFESSISGAMV
jgi:hypothetical protein